MSEALASLTTIPPRYRISPGADGVVRYLGRRASCVDRHWARMSWSGWPEDPVSRWLLFFPLFWIPGLGVTAATLYQSFVRQVWILRSGRFTRRYAALGFSMRREFEVTKIEVVHAVWTSARGSTDSLHLLSSWRRQRLVEREHIIGSRDPIAPEVVGLATLITRETGAPLRRVETVIPEPSSD
ncbi:MAG: hypothetical protein M3R37_00635 [Actinomycetota bacterium]|nr:hypothetical protein [Actinomycetota bacterium]